MRFQPLRISQFFSSHDSLTIRTSFISNSKFGFGFLSNLINLVVEVSFSIWIEDKCVRCRLFKLNERHQYDSCVLPLFLSINVTAQVHDCFFWAHLHSLWLAEIALSEQVDSEACKHGDSIDVISRRRRGEVMFEIICCEPTLNREKKDLLVKGLLVVDPGSGDTCGR